MSLESLVGQPVALATLARAVDTGNVASAYLFDGPNGTGKRTAAVRMGMALNCEREALGCGECPSCKRVLGGHHPDVRVFSPRDEGNGNLKVEFVREEILPLTRHAPFAGKHAVFIFPNADVSFPEMHPEAANAMLKTIEEPKQNVHFVFASSRGARLLDTVRSRCLRVRFRRLSTQALEHVLTSQGVAKERASMVIPLSEGRADVALALAEEGDADWVDTVLEVDDALHHGAATELLDLARDTATSKRSMFVLRGLSGLYRAVVRARCDREDRSVPAKIKTRATERAVLLNLDQASSRVEKIDETLAVLDSNANAEIAMDALFLNLMLLEGRT